MRNLLVPAAVLLSITALGVALPAQAHGHRRAGLQQCLKAATNVRHGDFIKVEYLSVTPEGVPSYEIEIRDPGGKSWEMTCSAASGDVYEVETEVEHANNPAFAQRAQIAAKKAVHIAQQRFGGTAAEVEYEVEFDGTPTYEIDLNQPGGRDHQYKVEVDATNGQIIEFAVEQWQIGDESNEDLGGG